MISPDKNFQTRLDLGLTYLSMDMDATLSRLDSNNDTTYFKVTNNEKGLDPFVSLTMNTKFENWIINPFFRVSYCKQTLFNITAASYEYSSNTNFFTLTPGITYRASNNILIILGGDYIIQSDIENPSSKAIYSGFLQANFLLEY